MEQQDIAARFGLTPNAVACRLRGFRRRAVPMLRRLLAVGEDVFDRRWPRPMSWMGTGGGILAGNINTMNGFSKKDTLLLAGRPS